MRWCVPSSLPGSPHPRLPTRRKVWGLGDWEIEHEPVGWMKHRAGYGIESSAGENPSPETSGTTRNNHPPAQLPKPPAARRRAFFKEMCPRTHNWLGIHSEASARCGDLTRKETSSRSMSYNATSIEARPPRDFGRTLMPSSPNAGLRRRSSSGSEPVARPSRPTYHTTIKRRLSRNSCSGTVTGDTDRLDQHDET